MSKKVNKMIILVTIEIMMISYNQKKIAFLLP